ncbi:MAG: hypothetical protein AABZ29_03400 [Gemmatimonadota bacterium]
MSLVRDGNRGIAARSQLDASPDGSAEHLDATEFHRQLAAARHRIARIRHEVDDDLLELAEAGQDSHRFCAEPKFELISFVKQLVQDVLDVAQGRRHIHHLGLHVLLARERHELPDERRRAMGGPLDLVDVRQLIRALGEACRQQVRIPHDRDQQVVEVVSNAPGHAPDGFHLLREAKALLEHAALGDVSPDDMEDLAALTRHGRQQHLDRKDLTIRADVVPFKAVAPLLERDGDHLVRLRERIAPVGLERRGELGRVGPEDVLPVPGPEHHHRRLIALDERSAIDDQDGVGGPLEEFAIRIRSCASAPIGPTAASGHRPRTAKATATTVSPPTP